MLEIVICEVRGRCPIYKVGDKIVIRDPVIDLKATSALCIHVLPTILHYALILDRAWNAVDLGLTKPEDKDHAYIQCVDPGEPYTPGGTVIFKIRRVAEGGSRTRK